MQWPTRSPGVFVHLKGSASSVLARGKNVSLVCEKARADGARVVQVSSDGAFQLTLILGDKTKLVSIPPTKRLDCAYDTQLGVWGRGSYSITTSCTPADHFSRRTISTFRALFGRV